MPSEFLMALRFLSLCFCAEPSDLLDMPRMRFDLDMIAPQDAGPGREAGDGTNIRETEETEAGDGEELEREDA